MTSTEYQQLVEFLGRQFGEVDRRFSQIDHRFAALELRMDERFAEVLGHFDEVYRRLERLEQEYQAITQALRRIETILVDERGRREMLERDLVDLKRNVAALQVRIEELEARLRS